MNKILIGITTADSVFHETMESIYNLELPEDTKTELKIVRSYNVADGRNQLVDYMLSRDFTHILFVDSDMVLPKNALKDLLGMQWYVTTGIAYRKEKATIVEKDPYTTCYIHEEENKTCFCPHFARRSYFSPGLITPVDCVGLFCALVHRDVFTKITKPYFFFAHEEDKNSENSGTRLSYCIGEDMWFCRKVLQEAGIQIWAHGSCTCGHIGKYIYGLD